MTGAVMPRLRRNNGPFDMTGEDDPKTAPQGIGGGVGASDADISAIPTQPPSPIPTPSTNPGPVASSTPTSAPVVQNNMPSASPDMSGGMPGVSANDVPLATANATAGSAGVNKPVANTNHGVDLPDITTMPGYSHMTDLQGQLSDANRPLSTKGKIIRAIMEAAPVALGGALGGISGAGGAAGGVNAGVELAHQQGEHHKDDLIRQVQQAQGQVTTQYDHNLQARNIAATRDMTAQWHNDNIAAQNQRSQNVIQGQNDRASDRNDLGNRKLGLDPSGQPIPLADLTPNEQAKISHQQAQDAYIKERQNYTEALRTGKVPADIENAKARMLMAQKNMELADRRMALGERGMDLREEGMDFRENGPTAQQKNQVGQASVIGDVGPKLIEQIRKNADLLGPYNGRATNIEEFIGNLPPQAAYLSGLQGSFAALQPQLHGMRGQGAMKNFEARLQAGSFKTNAEAMEAAVQATIDSAATIKKALSKPLNSDAQNRRFKRNGTQDTTQSNTGDSDGSVEEWVRGPNGQLVRKGGK